MTLIFTLTNCTEKRKLPKISPADLSAYTLEVNSAGLSKLSATMKTVHGNLKVQFYPKLAPNTVNRLIKLIQSGFYDGLAFHKVIPNFVVQTGDPSNTGNGGSGFKLKAEFNNIPHIRGTIAMARLPNIENKDSADSQFYIALNTLPHLDKKFTVFAQVTDGLEILNKITIGDKILSITLNN